MDCQFQDYTVSRYGEEKVKIAGRAWSEAVKTIEDAVLNGKGLVVTIVGEPGMGKTTVLNAVKGDLKDSAFLIYLDLVTRDSLSSSAWRYIKETNFYERVRAKAYEVLASHKEELGYIGLAKLRREFNNWLSKSCESGKWNEKYGYAQRLYCMAYKEDINGLIQFLTDLTHLGRVGLLIDEIKPYELHFSELHKLINEAKVAIAVTMTSDVYDEVKDSALKRRFDEMKVELEFKSEDDKLDILKVYCPELAEDLLKVREVKEATRVSSMINAAREAFKRAKEACQGEEYKPLECIRHNLGGAVELGDLKEASLALERAIREALIELKDVYRIRYVHDRGRRLETDKGGVTVDLYFFTEDTIYIGDVKLSDKETLDEGNLKNVSKLENYEREGRFKVVKFIVTNARNAFLKGFKIVYVDNATVKKVIEGDKAARDELVRKLLKEIGLAG